MHIPDVLNHVFVFEAPNLVRQGTQIVALRPHKTAALPRPSTDPPLLTSSGASGGHVGTLHAQRAHDKEKWRFFDTIGNILAYTDHTTAPQCWTAP